MLVGSSWKIPAAPRPILGYRKGCHLPVTCQRDRQDGPSTLYSFIPRCHQHIPDPFPLVLFHTFCHYCPPGHSPWQGTPIPAHGTRIGSHWMPTPGTPGRCHPNVPLWGQPSCQEVTTPGSPAPPARALGWDSQQPGPARAASKPRQRSRARMLRGGTGRRRRKDGRAHPKGGRRWRQELPTASPPRGKGDKIILRLPGLRPSRSSASPNFKNASGGRRFPCEHASGNLRGMRSPLPAPSPPAPQAPAAPPPSDEIH